jgi:hypothetical protein
MHKKIIQLLLTACCFLFVSIANGQGAEALKPIKFEQVELTVPESWEFQEGPMGVKFSLLTLPKGSTDEFRENVNFNYMPSPVGAPSNEDFTQIRDQMLTMLKEYFKDIELGSTSFGTFGGMKSIDFDADAASLGLHWNWRIFTNNGVLYIVTSTCRMEESVAWWQVVQSILNNSNLRG